MSAVNGRFQVACMRTVICAAVAEVGEILDTCRTDDDVVSMVHISRLFRLSFRNDTDGFVYAFSGSRTGSEMNSKYRLFGGPWKGPAYVFNGQRKQALRRQ